MNTNPCLDIELPDLTKAKGRVGLIARLMVAQRTATAPKVMALKAAYYSLCYGAAASKAKALYLATLRGTKA